MFHGGTIFADNATGYIDVRHQVSLGSSETVKSKLGFERDAHDSWVVISSHHTDNGIFTSKEFMEVVLCQDQKVRFSGVGAAHQNGIAERAIRTIVTMARIMLLHAAMHAPDLVTKELWHMAMDHAVWLCNRIPDEVTGLAPLELWTKSTCTPTREILSHCHVWGCPVFVLEPKLQKGGVKIPKWAPRSRQGLNMGFSKSHSSSVALNMNLSTKSISAQFYTVFDDHFTTVPNSEGAIDPDKWRNIVSCNLA